MYSAVDSSGLYHVCVSVEHENKRYVFHGPGESENLAFTGAMNKLYSVIYPPPPPRPTPPTEPGINRPGVGTGANASRFPWTFAPHGLHNLLRKDTDTTSDNEGSG